MSTDFNYRHLYYFWVVAKEGGMVRAADRLDMAVQTVSAQVRELERTLGHTLLKPAGRGLALTDAGLAAMRQAEQIFQLGEQLASVIHDAIGSPSVRLTVGISEGLPKLAIRKLMQPVMQAPHLRLLCHENDFEDLLGELALHRLDVVLADRAAPPNPNLKVYSHTLGSSAIGWLHPQNCMHRPSRVLRSHLHRCPCYYRPPMLPCARA
jgi:LysR family transcriptional regulator, transcriptional activator of nhaA